MTINKTAKKPDRKTKKVPAVKPNTAFTALPEKQVVPGSPDVSPVLPYQNITQSTGSPDTVTKTNREFKLFLILIAFLMIGFYLGSQKEALATFAANPARIFRKSFSGTMSVSDLKKQLKNKNFTLINVHTPYEGEIEKTDTFIPYDQIVAQSASLPKDKNAPIVLYCKTGHMSSEAIETVQKLGYTNVRHVVGGMDAWVKNDGKLLDLSGIQEEVLPAAGVELPVSWGDIGPRLVSLGVIDLAKFKEAVNPTDDQLAILTQKTDKKISIDAANGQFVVDLLWALGLTQKSAVYDQGPMGREYKKDAANFASTGGWTLSRGNAMNYYNKNDLIPLTPDQQKLVSDISKNVYRPCCGNPTWFPDCNHGMAALAAIELMVAAGIPEKDIYRNVLALNSYWFPDSYLYVATYFARQGVAWKDVDAKMVLGSDYSSSKGAGSIAQKVGSLPFKKEEQGGGCGA